MRIVMILATVWLLAGCSSTGSAARANMASQVPSNYREQIVAYVRETFRDPYSIMDAQISPPTSSFVGLVNGGEAPGVCIRMNAKNAFGAYMGLQTQSVAFRNGRIMGITEPLFGTCTDVPFEPFPELEAI